jgi:hypothetical protein
MIIGSFLQFTFFRCIADIVIEKDFNKITPNFIGVLLLQLIISISLSVPVVFYFLSEYSLILKLELISIFIILVLINGLQYFLGIDIIASLKNILTGNPEIDIQVDTTNLANPNPNSNINHTSSTVPQIILKPQVFNIPENDYVYSDAKALCTAYGARLATYKEVEDTYNKGGEWCNYGWSDGQMALFPTQQNTYDKLQKIEGHENDCGRPGVNGGYMKNPEIKFGVNCYGYKPRMTPEEEDLMATRPIYRWPVR